MATRLQIEGLSVDFGELPALKDFNIEVEEGDILAILGPSGCGKTTLLNVVSGLQEPTKGLVILDGHSPRSRLGHSAHMHQEDRLLPWRTVKQNTLLASEFESDIQSRQLAVKRALRLLEEFNLASFLDHYPRTLSGGMSRRVALSRTLSVERGLFLLDEPLSGLDYHLRLRVESVLFRELREHAATALIVTHDIETALAIADRIAILTPRPSAVQRILECGIARASGSTVSARHHSRFSRLFLEILQDFDSWRVST